MKSFIALIALASLQVALADYQIVWQDEFNGGNLKDRWNFEVNCDGGGNGELQCYTDNRNQNVRQENGVLVIQAVHEKFNNRQFTSTRMTTKANWVYGKFEMRARMPAGKMLWPAFWMMPANSEYGTWPRSGEIDITEYRGQVVNTTIGTLHYGPAWNNKADIGTGERAFNIDFSKDFHVFGLDWNPDRIQWLLDGQVVYQVTLQRIFWDKVYTKNGSPFDKNFFIILNLAVGGAFFGGAPFDPSESAQWAKNTFEIDYVRVSQMK